MTIAFPDLSNFQAGLRIQPNTVAVIAKASEGNYYTDHSFANFRQQTANEGGLFSSYHYLRAGYGAVQAAYWRNVVGAGVPCMLDVENGSGGVGDVLAFIRESVTLGEQVWGVYLPHWYWQNIGSPNLGPLADAGAVLVSSNYTTYTDTGPGWNSYGGLSPQVWQYTDAFAYGGQSVDFNAYRGTTAQLAALWHADKPPANILPRVSVHDVAGSARLDPPAPSGVTTNFVEVTYVQRALVAVGRLDAADPTWGRGQFGTLTVAAYRNWQQSLGYAGDNADGIPGYASLSALANRTGLFTAVA